MINRNQIIQIFFLLGGLILLVKAAQLQIFDKTYQLKARASTIERNVEYPSRGLIVDRTGKTMVYNDPIYDLMVTYDQLDTGMDTIAFCAILNITQELFENNLNKNWSSGRYSKKLPFVFFSRIDPLTMAEFNEQAYRFPGFAPQLRSVRGYAVQAAAHVLGYISEVDAQDIEENESIYSPGDYIGKTGLEHQYEELLRGQKGTSFLLKDNLGREVGSYKDGGLDSSAVSGQNLVTSINIDLQSYGEKLMQNKRGSIVAIEPSSGEILTMISAPTYDPGKLTIHRNRGEEFEKLLNDSLQPFFDRSIMAEYPPGSIFKTIVALAAMQEGVLHPYRSIACGGSYYVNENLSPRKCHIHEDPTNVTIAIQHSCNSYFFQTFRELIDQHGYRNPGQGLATFDNYLREFGLGNMLGIDVPNENRGLIPTPEMYDRIYANDGKWRSTYIMSVGIGQGEIQLTTLQMANLAAAIANKGFYYTPHVLRQISDAFITIPEEFLTKHTSSVEEKYFVPVIEGMERAVHSGTATMAYIPGMQVCGKTGTSQNPHGEDHSVFFAFAPKEDPKIAIAVYVENAGWGGSYAAPIGGLMIEKYMNGEIGNNRKWIEERMLQVDLINKNP